MIFQIQACFVLKWIRFRVQQLFDYFLITSPIQFLIADSYSLVSLLNVINAFPIAISPVAMSWSSEEAARISVTFSYDYFNFAFQYDDFDGTRSGSITTQAPRMSSAELQSARAELTELTNRAEQRNTARLINQGGTP